MSQARKQFETLSEQSKELTARMAASFRVSAMAVPSPHARLARLLVGLDRLFRLSQLSMIVASPHCAIPDLCKPPQI